MIENYNRFLYKIKKLKLQPSLLDVSFDKHIIFEIMALFIKKKSLKHSRKLSKKPYIQFVKKFPKLNKKMRRKTKNMINEKPSNSMEK